MSVFFGGRKLTTPTTASVVDDSGLENKNLTVGNVVALIGRSAGGKPNTPLRFGTPSDARSVLREGDLLTAVLKAFDPSAQVGSPQEVVAIRVNPAVQASLVLKDAGNIDVITLKSTDYGLYTNQIHVKVEPASTIGKKLTVQMGNDYATQDNVARNAFKVRYAGAAATAVISVTATNVVLQAPSGTTVATIDLASYSTVQKVVDRINAVAGFSAAALDGSGDQATANGLDFFTSQDVKTADFNVTANLQAVVDWFNSVGEGFIDASRLPNVGTVPADVAYTYLTGGSDGSVTTQSWSDAYTTLQAVDVQWVTPISTEPAIWAMNDAHCAFMSTQGKMERRGVVGMAAGTSQADAIAAAKVLNSDRTSLVFQEFYDYDATGALVAFPPTILAAMISGAFSGVNPGTPLTNKTLKIRGLVSQLRNPTDTDQLIEGGVLCVENTRTGYKVVKSITTWLTNDNYNRVEVSTGVALDFVVRNVREALDELRGQKGTPIVLARAVSIAQTRLMELAKPEPQGPGVLTGDAENPPFKNIRAVLDGDVVGVEFECQPVIGVNFVLVSVFARAFSGSATA